MMEPEKTKKEAKQIMDGFMQELEKVKFEEKFALLRDKNIRGEVRKKEDVGFRERMLKNAPKVKDNFILAEKKKW